MAKDSGINAANNGHNGPGIGGMVSTLFGSSNNYQASAPEVDPNAYQYGGRAGYAQETSDRYRQQAEQAQNRQGVQADFGQANATRQDQAGLANAMRARAFGQTPSIAQMQADRQMQQANAAQSSAAASARGAAGIAMAQQNAANNMANQQAAISNQAQINAANERMQAEQAAFGAYGSMRGQDQGQAQFQAQLNDAQRARNDAMTMGMTQNEMGVQNTQLAAQMNQQAQQSSNQLGAAGINAQVAGQNAAMNQQNAQNLLSSVGNVIGGMFAKGGKMKGESPKPYLVGEEGPELVVPKKDGYVIPADQTKQILSSNAPTSTWGVGPGKTESMQEAEFWKDADKRGDDDRRMREADSRMATSGGMAIAGGPGTGTTLDEPLKRADQETISTARAKQAEGIELTPEEERKLGGAQYRAGNARQQDKKPTLASAMKSTASPWQTSAASIDVGYHGPAGGYIPPNLIQISGTRAMGGPIEAGGTSGLGQTLSFGPMGSTPEPQKAMSPVFANLAAVHHMPSMAEVNKSTLRAPGAAKGMQPGSAVAGTPVGARANGGPIEGSEDGGMVVPLFEPPGKWLQSTPDGRAYYIDAPSQLEERVDPRSASLAKALAPSSSQLTARAPVSPSAVPKPAAAKQRKPTDDELMREAERMQKAMEAEHAQYTARGPAVKVNR